MRVAVVVRSGTESLVGRFKVLPIAPHVHFESFRGNNSCISSASLKLVLLNRCTEYLPRNQNLQSTLLGQSK